ncbi:MAG: metallophosphoesterase family protein [Candidatus Bathyarchaeia archaeon]
MTRPSISIKMLVDRGASTKAIGLISDTHIPSRARRMPDRVAEVFSHVDLIIHAGDLTCMRVVDELEAFAPVLAVHGNMDPPEVKTRLPGMDSTMINGWRIGVIHDAGALWGMKTMRRIAEENRLDILVSGHIHRSFMRWDRGVLFINPGSPTNPLPPIITEPTIGLILVSARDFKPFIIGV